MMRGGSARSVLGPRPAAAARICENLKRDRFSYTPLAETLTAPDRARTPQDEILTGSLTLEHQEI